MNNRLNITADLALVRSIPDYVVGVKPGRLKGLYDRLRDETEAELAKLPHVSSWDIHQMRKCIDEFGTEMHWFGVDHHVSKVVSFCLMRLDGTKYRNIISTLSEIYDYFARVNDIPAMADNEGCLAAEAWERIFKSHFTERI